MSHYESVADEYESAFFYGDIEYRDWLLSHLVTLFRIEADSGERFDLVDIGGGTGNFTQALAESLQISSEKKFLCVDPFPEMLKKASIHMNVEPLLMDALGFSKSDFSYSYALMKEVIHHIPEVNLDELFDGIFRQLSWGGLCVILTRPEEVDYPFFPLAARIWKENQISSSKITAALERSGFKSVEIHSHSYAVRIRKSVWLKMISNRFWSTFSLCSDDEIAAGIDYLSQKHSSEDSLSFSDTILFILARKLR